MNEQDPREEKSWLGSYVSGQRLGVEASGWDMEAMSGQGPGRYEPDGFRVVQRGRESPHPLTWVSERFETVEEAHLHKLRIRMLERIDAGEHPGFLIGDVSSVAFARHQSAKHSGALIDEENLGCRLEAFHDLLRADTVDEWTALELDVLRRYFPSYAEVQGAG